MLIPLVFAVAPQAFVQAVDHRIAGTQLHVFDWWADDLDGDRVPEAIAEVCDEGSGFLLVLHGADLLEAPLEIDGRNDCAPPARPAWTTRKAGEVTQSIGVHHGSILNAYAMRDGYLALIRTESHGFDVNRDGSHTDETDVTDYDKLTWSQTITPGSKKSGRVVLAAEHPHRAVTLVGKTTLTATWTADQLTLHVHADRTLSVLDCNSSPCATSKVAAGADQDVPISSEEVDVRAGGATYHLHLEHMDLDLAYPTPPRPW